MSFEDYRRGVEIVSDPALVEKWKEEARTTTTIVTKEGEPPTSLGTLADARVHFRQTYFDGLLQSGTVRRVHGSVARNLPEASMMQAIRQEHEKELRYPARFVQLLREGLQGAGLHIFKHRKRVVYVSLSRPTPFVAGGGAVSENVAAILDIIGKSPLCTRKVIAEHVLARQKNAPAGESAPVEAVLAEAATPVPSETPAEDPAAKARAALAADLRFLVQAGHIIEFHNGTFDLPLPPKSREDAPAAKSAAVALGAKAKTEAEDVGADPASVAFSSPASVPAAPAPANEPVIAVAAEPDEAAGEPSVLTEEPAVEVVPSTGDALGGEEIADQNEAAHQEEPPVEPTAPAAA